MGPCPRPLPWLLAIVLTGGALPAAGATPPDCLGNLPLVLTVGLPYSPAKEVGDAPQALQQLVDRYYRDSPCPGRSLQVNVAFGNEYQLLDWVGRGAVDMAVVSSLALHLLHRDGVDLLEVAAGRPLLRPATAELASFELPGRRQRERGAAAADFGRFHLALWQAARRGWEAVPPLLPVRLVVSSHLSTTGFLVPVAQTQAWLEKALDTELRKGEAEQPIRERFWDAFFANTCFRFGAELGKSGSSCRDLGPAGKASGAAAPQIEVVVESRDVDGDAVPQRRLAFGAPLGDHLVIRGEKAAAIFGSSARFKAVTGSPLARGSNLASLFGQPRLSGQGEEQEREPGVPPAFEGYLVPDRYFGTRIFTFTVDEALHLLAMQPASAGQPGLALVLPGGGVKAAYQSVLIDRLYERGYLINSERAQPLPGQLRLGVQTVIGTSGGALLGFFVAQLGPSGPWKLFDVLWTLPDGDGTALPLDSEAVFGITDLPRYISLLTIYGLFCIGLALCSLGPRRWLAPERVAGGSPANPRARLALLLPGIALLLATPLLVNWSSRGIADEHVPEFEGLFYAVLLVLAMFYDQSLVDDGQRRAPVDVERRAGGRALAAGVALMVLPPLAAAVPVLRHGIAAKIPFVVAYLLLGFAAVAMTLVGVRRRGSQVGSTFVAGWVVVFAGGTAVALAALLRAPLKLLEGLDRTPLLFLALAATFVGTIVVRVARARTSDPRWYGWLKQRGVWLGSVALVRRAAAVVAVLFACLVMLDITRPLARNFHGRTLSHLLSPTVDSRLDIPFGGLLVCIGALLAMAGLAALLRGGGRLKSEGADRFADAVLFVVVGLAVTVYVCLWAISRLAPQLLNLFELTPEFWAWLVVLTIVVSAALLRRAYRHPNAGPLSRRLRGAVEYLCSRHPNAHLVTRRFVRLLVVAAGGLLWWNFLLAPGLYGNRYAHDYLSDAGERFTAAYVEAHKGQVDVPAAPQLTTRLLAVANALVTNGTHFFLVIPEVAGKDRGQTADAQRCPLIRQPPGSESTWYRYHAMYTHLHQGHGSKTAPCLDLDLRPRPGDVDGTQPQADRELLLSIVFASGSPFPIFPAHRVHPLRDDGDDDDDKDVVTLIDGGYSNNTPVEAAQRVGADRVLIVNSSNPFPPKEGKCGGSKWLDRVPGPLVANSMQLPALLFEKAQQLDRRGRAELFVVSLSPPEQCDWPNLAQFRRPVVDRMLTAARADLGKRIGVVESWGPPRFQVSFPAGGTEGAVNVPEAGSRSASKASS